MRGSLMCKCAGVLCILLLSLRTDGEMENKLNNDCTIAWGDLEPDLEYKAVGFETSTTFISPLIEVARFYVDLTLDEMIATVIWESTWIDATADKTRYSGLSWVIGSRSCTGRPVPYLTFVSQFFLWSPPRRPPSKSLLSMVGYVVTIILSILFIFIFPVLAVCLWLCYGRKKKTEGANKKDGEGQQKNRSGPVVLATVVAVISFFIILWTIFGLNFSWLVAWNVPYLHTAIDYSVDDVNTFVLNLKKHSLRLLNTNFFFMSEVTNDSVVGMAGNFTENFYVYTAALFNMDRVLKDIKGYKESSLQLTEKMGNLSQHLAKERDGVTAAMRLKSPKCQGCLDAHIQELDQLDFNAVIVFGDDFNGNASVDVNQTVKEQFSDMSTPIIEASTLRIHVMDQLEKVHKKSLQPIVDYMTDLQEQVEEQSSELRDKASEYIEYAHKLLITWSIVITLMMIFTFVIALLMLVGALNVRKGENADNTPSGRKVLYKCAKTLFIVSLALIFALSSILLVTTTLLYIFGAPAERYVCQKLYDPDKLEEQYAEIVRPKGFNITKINYFVADYEGSFSISQFLKACRAEKTIYTAINMKPVTEAALDQLKTFRNGILTTAVDVKPSDIVLVMAVADFNVWSDLNSLQSTVGIAQKMESHTLKILEAARSAKRTALAKDFTDLIDNDLDPFLAGADALDKQALELIELGDRLHANSKLLPGLLMALEAWLEDTKTTNYVITNELQKLRNLALGHVDSYVRDLTTKLEEDVGKCYPLYATYKAMGLDGSCLGLLDPMNGVWLSLGWCLLFFFILIFLLVVLIRKLREWLDEEAESPPSDETEPEKVEEKPSPETPPEPYPELSPDLYGFYPPPSPPVHRSPGPHYQTYMQQQQQQQLQQQHPSSRRGFDHRNLQAGGIMMSNSDEFDLNYISKSFDSSHSTESFKTDSADNDVGDTPDDNEGDVAADNEGDTAADNEGDTAADNEGDIAADNEGDIADDNEGDIADDSEGDAVDGNAGDTVDDNKGDTADDNASDTVDDNKGDTADDNVNDTVDDNKGDTVNDNAGDTQA